MVKLLFTVDNEQGRIENEWYGLTFFNLRNYFARI